MAWCIHLYATFNKSIDECIKFANIAASLKCKTFDSLKGIPYMVDLTKYLTL